MKVRHIFVAFAALVSASNLVSAQDLNVTAEPLNKTYTGKLIEVHKPSFEMSVPDSLTSFELDFDYSVFDQPYKVAGSFTPYFLTMKPSPKLPGHKKFYLEAGAGYTIHPTLDLVWSPFRNDVFKMDVYAQHRSYVGNYYTFTPSLPAEGTLKIKSDPDAEPWWGYDLMSTAGVDGRLELPAFSAGFDVSYHGLHSQNPAQKRMYDALDATFGLYSKPKNGSYFSYDVAAAYKFGRVADLVRTTEHLIDVDANFGQVMSWGHRILVGIDADIAMYPSVVGGQVSVIPHYAMKVGRWTLDAGFRISAIIRPKDSTGPFAARGQVAYPEIKVYYSVIPEAMRAYAHITGGNRLNTYASLLERNHQFAIVSPDMISTMSNTGACGLNDVTVERVSATLGLEGRIGPDFNYDVRGGYACYGNGLFDKVGFYDGASSSEASRYVPTFGYSPYQKLFVAMDWLLNLDFIQCDGTVKYQHVWGIRNSEGLFAPAALTCDVNCEYNWKKRIFAGVDCQFATGRKGSVAGYYGDVVIPGYIDLGVNCEYAVNRVFSVWARGGNLLNMAIQRNPLFAEKGVSATVGICLNL